jgi:cullin 1
VSRWAYLEEKFQHILFSLEQGMDMETYMGVYTAVHNFHTAPNPGNERQIGHGWSVVDRNGEALYGNILGHIEQQVAVIREASKSKSSEALLEFFVDQWQRYELAAKYINHLCRYLNRHWIRSEQDEGKRNIYDVYTLHLVQWKTNMFEFLHERAMESVLSLVERQRNGECVGYREIRKYVDSFGKFQAKYRNYRKICTD